MSFKYEVIGNDLYITDTVSSDVVFQEAAKECSFVNSKLLNGEIEITYPIVSNEHSVIRFRSDIGAESVDSTLTPFTEETFRAFCSEYLGKSSGDLTPLRTRVVVNQNNFSTVLNTIDSNKEYFLDEIIDLGNFSIEIPLGGIFITGHNFNLSGLTSSSENYTLFNSVLGGSGNILLDNFYISVSGANSKVYNLIDSDRTHTIELDKVNFINCTSLGEITDYRQLLETGTGRYVGTPELTLSGPMSGYRINVSNSFNLSDISSLFKEGTSLTFSGRFIIGINVDLPTNGSLIDFSESNILNDESLQISDSRVSRNGILNSSDETISPNINHTSIKSFWKDNVGLPNTTKYLKASCTSETLTTISLVDTYYPILGSFTVERDSHFDMPSNGEFRLLSGNGTYNITGDIVLKGTANDELDVRVTKSTDNGVTFPEEINHIKRVVNNLSGGIDRAFLPISFLATLSKQERVRIEVENKSGQRDVTMELDSYFVITGI